MAAGHSSTDIILVLDLAGDFEDEGEDENDHDFESVRFRPETNYLLSEPDSAESSTACEVGVDQWEPEAWASNLDMVNA